MGKILLNRINWNNRLRKLTHLYVSLERMLNTILICSCITFISTYIVCSIETKLMSVEWLQFVWKSNRSSTQPPKHNGDVFLMECRVSTALCAICLVITCACLCAEFLSPLCDVIITARCVGKLQKKKPPFFHWLWKLSRWSVYISMQLLCDWICCKWLIIKVLFLLIPDFILCCSAV